ncbi:MAG: sugar transferase [Planctomycetes bacterium]|nr:sugar transferase [Planctomycetota bacterium]
MLTNGDAQVKESARSRKTRRPSQLDFDVLLPAPTRSQRLYGAIRRGIEITLAFVLLAATAPFMFLAALGVKLTSKGPGIYTQARVGRDERVFTMYKLRTMVDNCESLTGPRWCMPDDPRITWFGWILRRTHLDELPQLLNVLKGEMSLVGPRPERPEFVAELEDEIPGYTQRHAVLPGITGLAQVHLPPDTDVDSVRRKLVYDLYYVRRFGPWLDFRLLVCTALRALAIPFRIAGALCMVPSKSAVEGKAAKPPRETSSRPSRAAA